MYYYLNVTKCPLCNRQFNSHLKPKNSHIDLPNGQCKIHQSNVILVENSKNFLIASANKNVLSQLNHLRLTQKAIKYHYQNELFCEFCEEKMGKIENDWFKLTKCLISNKKVNFVSSAENLNKHYQKIDKFSILLYFLINLYRRFEYEILLNHKILMNEFEFANLRNIIYYQSLDKNYKFYDWSFKLIYDNLSALNGPYYSTNVIFGENSFQIIHWPFIFVGIREKITSVVGPTFPFLGSQTGIFLEGNIFQKCLPIITI